MEHKRQLPPYTVAANRVQGAALNGLCQQSEGPLLKPEPQPLLVAYSAEDARRVVHEAGSVEDSNMAALQVLLAAVGVQEPPPVAFREGDGHG